MASRGASDHEHYVTGFYDSAREFSDDVKDDDACSALASPAADLVLQASFLQLPIVATGEADDDVYEAVATSGDALAAALGEDDTSFEQP